MMAWRSVLRFAGYVLCFAAWLQTVTAAQATDLAMTRVIYPSAMHADDHRGNYYVELLKLAMAKSDGHFEVSGSQDSSSIERAYLRMAQHKGIDVMWGPVTRRVEENFRVVPVLLDKGLLGWRLLLINRGDGPRFKSVDSPVRLGALRAGQSSEWYDTQVLRDNGLTVVTGARYSSLFPMLAERRFDYFPRGLAEIASEARHHPEFVVERHIALHYPVCTNFFVARDDEALAKQLELGLQRAQQDGSFEKLFEQFNGPALRAANLKGRRVFELRNSEAGSSCRTQPQQ